MPSRALFVVVISFTAFALAMCAPAAAFAAKAAAAQEASPPPPSEETFLLQSVSFGALLVVALLIISIERSAKDKSGATAASFKAQIDQELVSIDDMLDSYSEKNRHFLDAIMKGSQSIRMDATPEALRAAVQFLVAENQTMMKETAAYQTALANSRAQIRNLTLALEETKLVSEQDPLTQVYNRRYFDRQLGQALASLKDAGKPVCLILADLDAFKLVNDRHGHLVGDEVLKMFAGVLQKHARPQDTVARFGGEEFAIILSDMSLDAAVTIAEEMRGWLDGKQWTVAGKTQMKVTASFGVAQAQAGETPTQIIARADACLYAAKAAGRNRVMADRKAKAA